MIPRIGEMPQRARRYTLRPGAYAVLPRDGMVQAVLCEDLDSSSAPRVGLEALVPLRQNRMRELLGADWERTYYADSPHPKTVSVYVDTNAFDEALGTSNSIGASNTDAPSKDENVSSVA